MHAPLCTMEAQSTCTSWPNAQSESTEPVHGDDGAEHGVAVGETQRAPSGVSSQLPPSHAQSP